MPPRFAVPRLLLALAGLFASVTLLFDGAGASDAPRARSAEAASPVARIVDIVHSEHGRERPDPYAWLRKRDDPAVIAHLEAENRYADQQLAPLQSLMNELAEEARARIAQADDFVPFERDGYMYQVRIAKDAQHYTIVRWRLEAPGQEEVVLDVEKMAAAHAQYNLGQWDVSRDGTKVAFSVDFTGARMHRLFVRTMATGEIDDLSIDGVAGDVVMSHDGTMLLYARRDPVTTRAFQVWAHKLGQERSRDVLVYEEPAESFEVSLGTSKSQKYVFIRSEHTRINEVRFLPADNFLAQPILIEPRQEGVRYNPDHIGGRFFFSTNRNAADLRIVSAPEASPQAAFWVDVIPERPGQYITNFEVFDTFFALEYVRDATSVVRLFTRPDLQEIALPPQERGVRRFFGGFESSNAQPQSSVLRFASVGPAYPLAVYDFDTRTRAMTLRKRDRALEWFSPERYAVERIEGIAPDGERVPITLMYRKDKRRDGGNPIVINAYGAYGDSWLPFFSPSNVSLLDRGFVVAVAHVRGGRELGQRWYEAVRLLRKQTSFTDYIAATEALIAQGYADPRATYARGRSAGGLLVGVVANLRPDLYAGIVAEVPFVDVITSMSDPDAPLTTFEYEEWGNPANKAHYEYMLSYSPYDNVRAQNYPAMYVTAGLHDSQVSFSEPAKWVARVRAMRTDHNPLLFMTDMKAGHDGGSGRLDQIAQTARLQAWLIHHAGGGR